MFIFLSILVALAGVLMYFIYPPKTAEIGRIMFGVGILCWLLHGDPLLTVLK